MLVPLFPLPNLVLFPGVALPLYVFEERYRDLLRDVQVSGEPFGIVRVLESSEESGKPFQERVSRVGTLAHLRQAQLHDDGTSTILVVGGDRFEVQGFELNQPYLSAHVRLSPLEDSGVGAEVEQASARQVLAALLRLRPADADDIRQGAPDDALLMASFAANILPLDGDQREEILRAPSVIDRLELLLGMVPSSAKTLN
ncbi:LON peptidase substrate-binding domain-containing protein [Deinococcus sp.]|uniref:LON peptidase substrate-binding domain-containing protein n=1 Tax=Deinococcus sp. TaxID=47478 RepID=UPI002869DD90|nr:LON peptidase substrate-binding domain-containing protein [Deinococcus sp.]